MNHLSDLTRSELAEILSGITGQPESDYELDSYWDLFEEIKRLQSEI